MFRNTAEFGASLSCQVEEWANPDQQFPTYDKSPVILPIHPSPQNILRTLILFQIFLSCGVQEFVFVNNNDHISKARL